MRKQREPDGNSRRRAIDIGQAIVYGAMGGVVAFAFTGNAAAIGIGACVGVLTAAVWNMTR